MTEENKLAQFVEACNHADAIDFLAYDADDKVYLRYHYCGPCFDESNLGNCEHDTCPLFTLTTPFCGEHSPANE